MTVASCLLVSGIAAAQSASQRQAAKPKPAATTSSKWEIEAHTGGSWEKKASSTLSLPAAGPTFLVFSGLESRQVPSFYFGDGAALLNAHLAGTSLTQRVTPLDKIFTASSVSHGALNPFGVRVRRALSGRYGVEFAFDLLANSAVADDAVAAAEATSSSYKAAFDARIGLFGFARTVTSAVTVEDGGRPMLATGALTIDLSKRGRLAPYVIAGGGVLTSGGSSPAVTLKGDVQFTSASATPYRQTDTVTVKYNAGTSFAMLAGAGFKYEINARSGVRFEFREHFVPKAGDVLLDWKPAIVPGTPTNTIAFGPAPAIEISTNGAFTSTLSLPAKSDYVVATGDGMRLLSNFSVGYYRRFGSGPAQQIRQPRATRTGPKRWQTKRVWEVDGHVGGMFGNQPTGGDAIPFAQGSTFITGSGFSSRYTSSWMFGDGAVLINQMAAAFTGGIPVADRMSALDPVLQGVSVVRSRRVNAGARVSRQLSPRIRAEFTVDSTTGKIDFTSEAMKQIEATRASFVPVWNGIIGTGGGVLFTNSAVSATKALSAPGNTQTAITGGVEVRLWDSNTMVAYATGAVGTLRRSSALPEATLTGQYSFLFGGTAPLLERDVVRVHYVAGNAPLLVFGGGVRYFMSPSRGLRIDFRVHVSGNTLDTFVDATPFSQPGSPTFAIASVTTPSIQFSNTAAVRGNLSGGTITNRQTFVGSGQEIQGAITVGYFVRF